MREFSKVLGSNMRQARQRINLTQEQVAESLDMPVEVYGRMERGSMLPRMEMFVAICRTLGATPDQLLGYSQTRPDPIF
ncbi:helix-turn-helix domain-containing protein [Hyalangium gracile]|uniref:helix-turn-helix domain-containing protein n=1 Tax=Hyalangium gracile TaxID=394092 RepID=UPI001CCE0470|nr:helix-turn-helix transcriptional regulator [Hyalangium gracile]